MDFENEDDFYSEESLSKIELNTGNPGDLQGLDDKVSPDLDNVNEEDLAESYSISLDDIGDIEVEESEEDANSFSPEERLRQFADSVMSACLKGGELGMYAIDKLLAIPSPKIFRDENYILFMVLYSFRGKLRTLKINDEFIRLWLVRNKKMVHDSKGLIDLSAYGEIDGSVELGYIGGVIKHYKRLLTFPDMTEIEFNTVLEKYIIEYRAIEADKILQRGQQILTDGVTIGRTFYSGFKDSNNYVKRAMAELDGIDDVDQGSGFISAREMILEKKTSANKSYKVSDFGRLDALNKIFGGIYTGMFYNFIAPPKSGKTKLLTRIAHTTSVVHGNNVSVWAAEGGKENFLAELRAIHFDYTYNTGVSVTERKFGITQDVIAHGKFPNQEVEQLEYSSALDFASNVSYGNVDFIDRPFNVENYIEDITTSVQSNNSKVLILDYLQYMGSERPMSERERVSEAYKATLKWCRANNVAVVTVGQYKQDAFEALVQKGNTQDAEMRSSGGVSSEVIRTPDILIAMWATTQDLLDNSMKLLSMPSRFQKAFAPIDVMLDLSVSQFVSVE